MRKRFWQCCWAPPQEAGSWCCPSKSDGSNQHQPQLCRRWAVFVLYLDKFTFFMSQPKKKSSKNGLQVDFTSMLFLGHFLFWQWGGRKPESIWGVLKLSLILLKRSVYMSLSIFLVHTISRLSSKPDSMFCLLPIICFMLLWLDVYFDLTYTTQYSIL